MKKLITMLLLTAGVSVYSQENANQTNSFNIAVDSKNPCREFMMEVFPDKGNCSAQILNVYAWGVKENEPINWRLLDNKKIERASGTFTATQTRNVNRRIELPNLPSGNYTFVATSTSCPKSPKEYSLQLQALLQMSLLEKQDIGCNNKSSDKGSVLLRVSGGEKDSYIYSYEKIEEGHKPCGESFDIRKPDYADDNINGAPTYDGVPCWQKGTTNGNTFISLDEGIWRIYAMDPVRGCVVSDTVTIRRYPILSITSIVAQLCQVQTDGTIPVHITLAQRGQGKHYYQLNGQAEQPIQFTEGNTFVLNVLPNSYKITIHDERGCYAYGGFEVKAPTPMQLNVRAAKATCATEKGQLTLSIVSKEATATKRGFSYHITGNTVVTGTTANDSITLPLPAGAYQIEVTVAETGCKLYDKVLMPEPPATIQVSATPLYSKDCTQENGEIALHISGGQAPYKVRLVHQTTKSELSQTLNSSVYTFTGVTAGNYTIEVQDAAGCSRYEGTTSVTVQPSFVLKNISFETLKKATCERKEEVLVKVAVTPKYVKGTWLKYIITSEDKNYRREIHLDDTTLQLNGTEALGVGKYHIEVLNEQTKCSIGEDYEVKSVAEDYRLVVGTPVKATCSSGKGLLTLSIQNKQASATKVSAFDYRITANSVVTGTSTNGSAMIRLSAGSYQIEVTVAETGCKLYGKVIMPEPPAALKLATTVQASANCEDAKGAAIVQVSGGVSPYTITLTHKRTGTVYSETNVGVGANAITLNFSDLKSGYYYAHVQDAAGCEAMGSVTIEEYTPIVLSKLNAEIIAPSCGDVNNGKLIFEVQVSGGVPPYKYKLEKKTEKTPEYTLITVTNGKGSVENLSSGSYQLLVEDSKNCITTITETTIIAPKPISVDIKVNKSQSQACDDSQNGSVTLSNIAGGSGFYRIYLINHEKKTVVDRKIGVKAGETVTFGNLASSYNIHYEIAIQDTKGCMLAHLAPFTIDEEPDVAVQSVENEINCDPTSNKGYVHTLVVKFNNNVVDYDKISYNLNNGTERLFTRTAGNIAFIDDFDAETLTQTLTVNYKPMGVGRPICPASIVNFSLTRFPQFTLERVPNDDLNVIEVIAKGGVTDPLSGYTYYFNGENQGNNPVYTIKNTDPERIEAGGVRIKTIEVKAKDAKDCIRTLVVEVPYIDIDIPNYFTPNGDGDNDRWRPKKMEDFPNAFVHVFDRNGRRMATLKPGESWDGIYAGKPMPSGDYWYTIDLNDELRDGRRIYGHFSLYR
ncbi:gliding motility-associated-like protein [Capnocytophaga leadbetteri]|uniref:Gliding motility-associated-like protein n=1 Tax=Capnocytophaga leadbetteri TaxID=327575 RepID=A0A2T5XT24_9FLAO|nr:T9SS type B sorting domain-containing protein [Capnocytophaga leadbetteri]PTX05552.1 gliding motility-associated-like protein [Capnocytophaga leadbetteri]